MVKVDFDQVDDAENFVSVPNGAYLCSVGEVRVRTGNDGAERWGIRWVVAEGPFAGRTAAWDSLVFHARGLRRAKLVLARLGLAVEGPQEVRPSSIEGRRALVTVYAHERVDPMSGRRIIANRVPFAGVEAVTAGADPGTADGDGNGETNGASAADDSDDEELGF
ncbi:MAG TPA: hypothetical protein VKE69_13720 [Planctomycetota bacterium]|nr:hypothetical protein [Planctomycetota bacterium]